MKTGVKQRFHADFFYGLFSSTLKTDVICSSETSVDHQRSTRRYIPENRTLHKHRCENVIPCIQAFCLSKPILYSAHCFVTMSSCPCNRLVRLSLSVELLEPLASRESTSLLLLLVDPLFRLETSFKEHDGNSQPPRFLSVVDLEL
jgi:hypothetical protein